MNDDRTLHQTDEQQAAARTRSENRDGPPAQIPGYDLEYCAGSGAYGEVWVAIDRNTRRKVAVKFYTHRGGVDVGMLSREVEKLARLSADRYVVQLLDVGWNAAPPYYVMDYIDNGSLEDLLRDQGCLPKTQALSIFQDVLLGLMHLHNKGILHCDLKPGNVLLDEDWHPRLADFGQARMHSEQNGALGTLFYMAPEQADLEATPDVRWDVYSAGVLLYCMLAGEPPHRDEDFLEQLQRTESVKGRLEAYRNRISRSVTRKQVRGLVRNDPLLAEILEKCLAPSPHRRYQSVHEVLAALQERENRATRRPLLILGLATPVLLMAIMLTFFWFMYQKTKSDTDAAILEKAGESNRWAAQLAASSASVQIDRYFRLVVELADAPELKSSLKEILGNPGFAGFQDDLADPRNNSVATWEHDRQFLAELEPVRRLHERLLQQLNNPEYPEPASIFICDPYGTQVATTFEGKSATNVLGKNYAYRSYFSGLHRDLNLQDESDLEALHNEQLSLREHIQNTHFSAAFRSTANQHWKVAFTAPIFDGEDFLGVIAATVDTGEFVEFNNRANQYAMLIDARSGPNQGTILEHPYFSDPALAGSRIPDEVFELRISPQYLESEHGLFQDPIGQFGADIKYSGSFDRYGGNWIAGKSSVKSHFGRPRTNRARQETGLVVIAAEDYQVVMEPAERLSESLIRLGTWTLLCMFAVFMALAWFALRTVQQSSRRILSGGGNNSETAAPSA